MAASYHQHLVGETAMLIFGEALGEACRHHKVLIFLDGNLGAGKTTLSRGVIKALGHDGKVKSPTYTLVEPYELTDASVYHFDLYRLNDPEELEYMGIRDYFESSNTVCLIEWPDKGRMFLPEPDIVVRITILKEGRELQLDSHSSIGDSIIESLVTKSRVE